jgi:hypothetical protein
MVQAQLIIILGLFPTSFRFPVLPSAILERLPLFVNKKFAKNLHRFSVFRFSFFSFCFSDKEGWQRLEDIAKPLYSVTPCGANGLMYLKIHDFSLHPK